MTKEIYSELNEAQKIIYTPSMISRAFPDFVHGQISNIYRVGKNCIVKRKNGNLLSSNESVFYNYLK